VAEKPAKGAGAQFEAIVYSLYLTLFIGMLGLSYLVFAFNPLWLAFVVFLAAVVFVVAFAARLMYRSPA